MPLIFMECHVDSCINMTKEVGYRSVGLDYQLLAKHNDVVHSPGVKRVKWEYTIDIPTVSSAAMADNCEQYPAYLGF